jgi:hypothetical protein
MVLITVEEAPPSQICAAIRKVSRVSRKTDEHDDGAVEVRMSALPHHASTVEGKRTSWNHGVSESVGHDIPDSRPKSHVIGTWDRPSSLRRWLHQSTMGEDSS